MIITKIYFAFFVFLLALTLPLKSQYTYMYFQNNTNLSIQFTTTATNGLSSANWNGTNGAIIASQPETELLRVKRLFGFSFSPVTYELIAALTPTGGTTIQCKLRIIEQLGTTSLSQSVSGSGFNQPYYNDNTLHSQNITINGTLYKLRYAAYSTVPEGGSYDDVIFSLDYVNQPNVYSVSSADVSNPAVLNTMSYNVYMRPTSLFPNDDQVVRANHIHNYVHNMDVIMLQEVFDNDARSIFLANLATEYPYQSTVIDDPSNPLEDGGVLIVSRWPIEVEDQYLWGSNCVDDDCTANKGIKYVRINKLGTPYHLFATHMDAFNDPADVDIRKVQLLLFKNFIDSKNIPTNEAVVMGGDFNIDKFTNKAGEYDSLWTDYFKGVMPTYSGNAATWDTNYNFYLVRLSDPSEYLDYVITRSDHRPTISNNNNVLILRSNHDEMFRIFDLSDHFAVWSRIEFGCTLNPIISGNAQPCTGQSGVYSVNPGPIGTIYNWTVTGGNIISPPPYSHTIEVLWTNGTSGTVSITQSTP